jgi:hypothetical protein
LKLWLEFTNDSKDQVFTPLDGRLLARDHVRESDFQRFANNFLRPAGQEISPEQLVFTLGHSPTDPFNIRDQNLGKRLQPGESCVMFVPSDEEGLAALEGDLVWRLQLRKGFHPETRHGVTKLIEVEFSTADVEAETAEESSETAETETT